MNPRKVVSLLELLRAYAEVYAASCYWLAFNISTAYEGKLDETSIGVILKHLKNLRTECERVNLEMTTALIDVIIPRVEDWKGGGCILLHEDLHQLCDDLERELSLQLFIKIASDRRKFFDAPFLRWEPIVKRFGQISRDVEEMNKCFALCRYTASMFHALQIAELGAIELGKTIGVTDPKEGWGATERRLEQLVKAGHSQLPVNLTGKFNFLEQMHRETDSMRLAWRHKVDHAANRLAIVPNTDFTPDIAEHIMVAVRTFMLRLTQEMPE